MSGDAFDYVIVGGGSAGLLLAERLSADSRNSVCVLEAGPPDHHPFIHLPAGFIKVLFNPRYTWSFKMEPTANTAGRSLTAFQGKTLGGTSSINGMIYNRGLPSDFNSWAQRGNRGWSFDEVLPYFKRTETKVGIGDDHFRGHSGKLHVTDNDWFHPICEAFIAAAKGVGVPETSDYNGKDHSGVSYAQRTIYRGRRMSSARAFLRPAKSRKNLEIRTESRAISIVWDGKRATGVRYLRGSGERGEQVFAKREVILSCGALNTPRLLQLSGIGDASHLQSRGVQITHNLPGVGKSLKDHFMVRIVARAKNALTLNELSRGPYLGLNAAKWLLGRPNILGVSPSLVMVHGKSNAALDASDVRGMFAPGSYKDGFIALLDDHPGMTCGFQQHRPESSGSIQIKSSDPFVDPIIDLNYLASKVDQNALIGGLLLGRRIFQSAELSTYFHSESLPGAQVQTHDEWLDFARRYGNPANHYVGSARMGPATDPTAVVDDQLRVHGLQALRVADSSIMPNITSANTCCSTYMIAEKAADMIMGLPPLSLEPAI